ARACGRARRPRPTAPPPPADVRPQDDQVRPAVPRVPAQADAPRARRRRVRPPERAGPDGGPAGRAVRLVPGRHAAHRRGGAGMISLELTLAISLVCLFAEMFFSGSEIAVVSANRTLLRRKAAEGDRAAQLTLEFIAEPQRLLATTLLGTNISVVVSTTVVTLAFLSRSYPERNA